ncbi:MAG: phage terminase large subunit [Sulfurovum sp.]|nr:phage terminase large subunit [Sulfurovaceae bacterium]
MKIKLLPHQYKVLKDTTTKIIGLIGGYGNGKTYTACRKAIQLATLNAGYVGIVTEPTFPMLRDIFIPEMKIALEEWKVPYKFNASNSIFILNINGKESKILCMSMENVSRLVGINASWIICDEFDTSKMEVAMSAFNKLLGRLRSGNTRQFIIFTTPEGHRAAYKIFVQDNKDGKRLLIKARTEDNKYLPKDFIETLKEQYPPNLLQAYLNGEFVNLNSETVYSYFDREIHHKPVEIEAHEVIHCGQDFNYNGSITTCFVIRDNTPFMFAEIISKDSYGIVENIQKRFKEHRVCIYPDASGNKHNTNATATDIEILRKGGLSIYAKNINPRIIDRVNSVNGLLSHNRFFIDIDKCPKTTEALEQQAYDDNGMPEKYAGSATVDDFTDSLGYFIYYKFPLINRSLTSKTFIL